MATFHWHCSLADIEMRLAQGLEAKQTPQEIDQALENKGEPSPHPRSRHALL
jgi:hypothetical protein